MFLLCKNNAKEKIDSYDSLSLEKTVTLHHAIIQITSIVIHDQNHYC